MRGAAHGWQKGFTGKMVDKVGFKAGDYVPKVFWHDERDGRFDVQRRATFRNPWAMRTTFDGLES